MKKLLLTHPIYNEFFKLGEEIQGRITEGDVQYIGVNEDVKELKSLLQKNPNNQANEIHSRIISYLVFDYGYMHQALETSESKILKTHILGLFQVQYISDTFVEIQHSLTGKIYKIIGEGEGNQRSLRDLNIGEYIVSRIICMPKGWYVLKNYYYFELAESEGSRLLKEKIDSKKGLLELEKILVAMYEDYEYENVQEVNPQKRFLKKVKKYLTKKQLQHVKNMFKNIDDISRGDIIEYMRSVKDFPRKLLSELENALELVYEDNNSVTEEDFYDNYDVKFTDLEYTEYERALDFFQQNKYEKAYAIYQSLRKKHPNFHRLLLNILSTGTLYLQIEAKNLEYGSKDISKLIEFGQELFEIVDILEEKYPYFRVVDRESMAHNLMMVLGLLRMGQKNSRLEVVYAAINTKDFESIYNYIRTIIPDFEIEECIQAIGEEGTVFVEKYHKEKRITPGIGQQEDDLWEIFEFLWDEHRSENDVLIDDMIVALEDLFPDDEISQEEYIELLDFFIQQAKKFNKKHYKKFQRLFQNSIEFSHIPKPENIIEYIANPQKKIAFRDTLKMLQIDIEL